MKRFLTSALGLMAFVTGLNAQTAPAAETTPTFGIKFTGFVRNDVYFDSRQVVSARPATQGELLLYPTYMSNDMNGKDLNAASSFSMMAITSRLSGAITGPDAFGAKTSGVLEAEFFGNANGNENIFRLRHAYVKLDWPKTQLGFGQYWHPLFVTDCFPGVINFNTGMPFQPFSRNPQIRLTQKLSKELNLIVAASSQTEAFVSPGSSTNVALGATASNQSFLSNAVIPNLHAQLQYKTPTFLAGAAVDYKSVRPAFSQPSAVGASTNVSTTETVNSMSFEVYTKITTKPVVIKAEYVAGQNLYDHLMIGGYLAYATTTPAAYNITYKPVNVSSAWLEFIGTGKKVIPAIFFGYTQNNGADDGAVAAYTRGITLGKASLDKVVRVAPRVEVVSGKFKYGFEVEVTTATYGSTTQTNGKAGGSMSEFTNTRGLFYTSYSF